MGSGDIIQNIPMDSICPLGRDSCPLSLRLTRESFGGVMRIILLLFLIILTSCAQSNPQELCLGIVEQYFDSLVSRDLQAQLQILEPFSLDEKSYWDGFLSHVKGGVMHGISIEHEDELLIMVKLDFTLILDDEFTNNLSFHQGENRVQRYFSFFRGENYRLKEILNKAIY